MVRYLLISTTLALAIGILIGKYAFLPKTGGQEKPVEGDSFDEVRAGGYQFISPLLECEPGTDSLRLTGLNPLQKEISSLIEDEKKSGTLTTAAVYFRDLNNGPWFGVNEHESFSPASLLKLPGLLPPERSSNGRRVSIRSATVCLPRRVRSTAQTANSRNCKRWRKTHPAFSFRPPWNFTLSSSQ
jgi:hypothetical protein